MRILPFHLDDPQDYSCVSYWVLGDNNTPADRNTLIDTGSAHPGNLDHFLRAMAAQPKGIGKRAVEQVILTHAHFDHVGGLARLDELFAPDTLAWLPAGRHHRPIEDGLPVVVGDQQGTLLHTPGHSEDSLCVLLPESGTLFSGDTLYRITDHLGAYPRAYVKTLERLAGLDIQAIYPGHGQPIRSQAGAFIQACLDNVHQSFIQD
jgi:glyoxylase-like metal-dependent hydrolase (beta-lactamase superfamily II)